MCDRYKEMKVGHLHPEHLEIEEEIETGIIKAKKVKYGKLSVPKFGE